MSDCKTVWCKSVWHISGCLLWLVCVREPCHTMPCRAVVNSLEAAAFVASISPFSCVSSSTWFNLLLINLQIKTSIIRSSNPTKEAASLLLFLSNRLSWKNSTRYGRVLFVKQEHRMKVIQFYSFKLSRTIQIVCYLYWSYQTWHTQSTMKAANPCFVYAPGRSIIPHQVIKVQRQVEKDHPSSSTNSVSSRSLSIQNPLHLPVVHDLPQTQEDKSWWSRNIRISISTHGLIIILTAIISKLSPGMLYLE